MSDKNKMEDEAIVDRGASYIKNVCDEEVEGHHTVYIGVHVPKSYRRRRRHRRRSNHKERRERLMENVSDKSDTETADDPSSSILKPLISPAAERIRFILGEDDSGPPPPQLFTELDELLAVDGQEMEWKETARWIKFEEKVEKGGERWSKPHVATLSLHSLFQLKNCIEKGTIKLDMEANSLQQIVEMITDSQIESGQLKADLKEMVMYTLLRKHRHQTKKSNLRSLADIGKSVSSASRLFSSQENARSPLDHSVPCFTTLEPDEQIQMQRSNSMGLLCSPTTAHRNLTSNSLTDLSDKPEKDQLNNKFMKKVPRDAEASNVLVGEVDFLDTPFVAFVRLQQAVMLGGLTEVPVPTRFLFILLGPKGKAKSYHEIGRAIATLMSDEVFHDIAYKAKDRGDLLAGIDEFLDEVIVLPPGEWDPDIRIEPPKSIPSADKRKNNIAGGESLQMNGGTPHDGSPAGGGGHSVGDELKFTGKFCGGLILDVKRKLPFYASDFYDALNIQSLSAILFIYLGTVTNAITFGGLLGDATDNMQGVLESFVGTALAGAVFCLFAGQPLTILSSTGPVLVFERLLFNFSKDNDFDYLEFRLWIGLWSVRQLISDFAIILAILIFCGVDALVGVDTPKLLVPSEFKPTSPNRGWFVPPFGGNPWWVYLASFLPALLVTILVFMDQQITAVIVNRKEHKLKKGAGYHLDLFWVSILLIVCSFMGLPWYVAATVISIAHIDSIKMETETSAPGEQPKFLGVREQRVTGTMVFILTGLSVLMAPILKFIPMPVLYGVFLYMGVASLNGVQFMDRLQLLLMPAKHQPDLIYLRHVPLRRVHLFTFIQVLCLALLWVLKSTFLEKSRVANIIIRLLRTILALVAVRKAMDYVFSQHDLSYLDDIMPEKDKKKKEDEKKKKKKKGSIDSDMNDESPCPSSLPTDGKHFFLSKTVSSQDLNPFKKTVPQIRIDLDPDNNKFFWKTPASETSL
ncbi:electrogenic sodium bicarbonate cotransporter 1-like [Sinocyclocheilus grahami]|uniref:electrogenic sodium bicarbonate cotransporter 1-like n=1 Tax=Sinocyclocheilus grahami TaxID=75366 RepID=UPI0007ACAB3A|nr:PREDICTED: electrogenic sodium bicarbonate cotransporter 1-like [Sinocyclocheilus grahami]